MKRLVHSLAVVAGLTAASSAVAATATGSFNVTATVVSSCTVTATNLAFGNYTPSATNVDATATDNISVRCTSGTPFNVGLNEGLAAGATVTNRRMRRTAVPANELGYQLFTTAGYGTNWGNTVGTDTVTGNGTGIATPVLLSVFGRIPGTAANQNAVPASDYTDTVTVTVTY